MTSQNPLEKYFYRNHGRQIHKWVHYFDIYHRHLKRFRGKPIPWSSSVSNRGFAECGGAARPGAELIGVDIEPRCKQ